MQMSGGGVGPLSDETVEAGIGVGDIGEIRSLAL